METSSSGGPAFPVPESSRQQGNGEILHDCEKGMSLRDYFAAKAMQAMIAHRYKVFDFTEEGAADEAYEVADAMLKAREA